MRTVHTTTVVYSLGELSDSAREKAIQGVQEQLATGWDSSDTDDITNAITYTLAEKLSSPGWDTFGEGDFPGINGVTIAAWRIDQGESLAVAGTLDRNNAPGLPWPEGVEEVTLTARRDSTEIELVESEAECTCPPEMPWTSSHNDGCPSLVAPVVDATLSTALKSAVTEALRDAWKGGEAEHDYKLGEEYAKEVAENSNYEFEEDGTLWS